ncbi:chorismate mutase [Candidatus Bathyarchaeota archaeon]|jgi:chorismate mutase|nr:chorismate mutase [Candidatus Bathyarchaeota archaeon]MBT4320837.1 chorismate mutase [Candidatus Bathyarchaeota archaeon]MBT4423111.1 chorismate mutase [Candidatus Bathyarchaeota archaeon]MBT6605487.1 chorismate mutase [Candidatus Bathyarchaeota archaeon]MBT7186143.1 chorismate mutase [Candidatus Bathyarchaeota archaeon]
MYEDEIRPHRETIDRLNNEIINKLKERVGAALKIGEIKKHHGKPVVDKTREQTILDRIRDKAQAKDIDPDGLERIFKEIINLCVEAEERQ